MGQGSSANAAPHLDADRAMQSVVAKQFFRRTSLTKKKMTMEEKRRRGQNDPDYIDFKEQPTRGNFVKPSVAEAKLHQAQIHPRIDHYDGTFSYFPLRTSLMTIGSEFGVGTALYFRWLIYLGLVFLLYLLTAIPWVAYNQRARYLDVNGTLIDALPVRTFETNNSRLDGLTLAAILELPGLSPQENAELLVEADFSGTGDYIRATREGFLMYIALSDLGATIAMMLGTVIFFKIAMRLMVRRVEDETLEVSNYTVKVVGLPSNAQLKEVVAFFESRFGDVVEVQMCQDDYQLIRMFRKRRAKLQELRRMRAKFAKGDLSTYNSETVERAVRSIDSDIRELQQRRADQVVAAFVTFDSDRSVKECLQAFRYKGLFRWLLTKKEKMFRGEFRLQVKMAEPPTNIFYENLKFGAFSRIMRHIYVGFIVVFLLCMIFLVFTDVRYRIEDLKRKALFDTRAVQDELDLQSGSSVLDAFKDGAPASPENFLKVRDYCEPFLAQCESELVEPANPIDLTFGNFVTFLSDPYGDAAARAVTTMYDCYLTEGSSTCTDNAPLTVCYACYCQGLYYSSKMLDPTNSTNATLFSTEEQYFRAQQQCKPYFKDATILRVARWGLVMFTLAINYAFKLVITQLVKWERNHSRASMEASKMVWILVAQYVNTAVLDMLANVKARNNVTEKYLKFIRFKARFFNGSYRDFTQDWYAEVGNNITYTILLQCIGLPITTRIGTRLLAYLKREWYKARAVLQEDLNKAFEGPPFDLAIKIAEFLLPVCVALTYGSGIPILYFFVFLSAFFIRFWVDKYELLRVCKTPPRYSEKVIAPAYIILMFFICIHLAVGGWQHGHYWTRNIVDFASQYIKALRNPGKLQDIGASGILLLTQKRGLFDISRLIQANVFGLYLLLAVFVGLIILIRVVIQEIIIEIGISKVICNLCCFCIRRGKKRYVQQLPLFNKAFDSNLLKGVATYSIMENPLYKMAFRLRFNERGDAVDPVDATGDVSAMDSGQLTPRNPEPVIPPPTIREESLMYATSTASNLERQLSSKISAADDVGLAIAADAEPKRTDA